MITVAGEQLDMDRVIDLLREKLTEPEQKRMDFIAEHDSVSGRFAVRLLRREAFDTAETLVAWVRECMEGL